MRLKRGFKSILSLYLISYCTHNIQIFMQVVFVFHFLAAGWSRLYCHIWKMYSTREFIILNRFVVENVLSGRHF